MSKPRSISTSQDDLFKTRLSTQLNPRNPLFQLAQAIDWSGLEESLDLTFSVDQPGQPPKPVRLMIGLLMLQHMDGLSDEKVVEKWVENPYWQYFCGYDFFQWSLPINPSSLTRWRDKLGEDNLDKILSATLTTATGTGVAKEKDFERVIADTTVMEANIAPPRDSTLLNRAREKLVQLAHQEGLCLRQSYAWVGKRQAHKVSRYAHARQFKRMSKSVQKLKTYLGRVVRDIERKMTAAQGEVFKDLLEMAKRLLAQEKHSKDKLYSLHEPDVYCVSKGKASKPYEFGTKVALVVSHKQGLVLSSRSLDRPAYDGHTLRESLDHSESLTGVKPKQSFVDKGYRGHGVEDSDVYVSGQRRGMTQALKKALKRRSAIEPHIGHMKADGKLCRKFLKGLKGARFNAILCAIGHNLRLILNKLRIFFALILNSILKWIADRERLISHYKPNLTLPI